MVKRVINLQEAENEVKNVGKPFSGVEFEFQLKFFPNFFKPVAAFLQSLRANAAGRKEYAQNVRRLIN